MHVEVENMIQGIEEKEQNLIQQVRTAGIRKPRETSLVEEILDLRKDRRKLYSMLTSTIDEQMVINGNLESLIKSQQSEVAVLASRLEQELESRQRDTARLHDMHKQALELLKEKHAKSLKEERKKTTAKYEEKLSDIELKLNELMRKNVAKETERSEREASVTMEIENQCELRIKK